MSEAEVLSLPFRLGWRMLVGLVTVWVLLALLICVINARRPGDGE